MFFVDRLDALVHQYCLNGTVPLAKAAPKGTHEVLNLIDIAADIDTSGGLRQAPIGRHGVIGCNPVGARVALHEEYLAQGGALKDFHYNPRTYYHWLGEEANCSCGCNEHIRT